MVEEIGRELLELGRARNERLRKIAEENCASEAAVEGVCESLVDAIKRLDNTIDELREAENQFKIMKDPYEDEEIAFLLEHGIDILKTEANNTESEPLPEEMDERRGKAEVKDRGHAIIPKMRNNVRRRSNSLTKRPLEHVTIDDFTRIPCTTRARLDLNSLNEMIEALNEAFAKKASLLNKPIRHLSKDERDLVYSWKSLAAVEELHNKIFVKDDEFRCNLGPKLRLAWSKAGIPCLRALKLIEEVRYKGSLFIVPIRK